ncbi:MAG: hypothetical protein COZ85_04145 [Candidatus Moranbacteria bacterium CG_4_8_14_3_um_filter_34_16]|nr:MAG: hypothetical protein COT31_00670 [Candidatus Moranbacteria bacterium CG08_land_8_20_14_0_20_34_16]PIW94642.1 MAG: hypothetical protein COZ85_04145 [Candidatus Moranbacteria bacterium CG_4_8_14_3_um_filter_34_16]
MNSKIESKNNYKNPKGLEMYFSPEIAEKFSELEQNEKNFRVAKIVDAVLMQESANIEGPIYSAELGGGAHPDRYDNFFEKLIVETGHMDWVDVSPFMLEEAKKYISDEKYQKRREVITFIKKDILEYLRNLEPGKLDIAIMKYTIDHIENLEMLFSLLWEKLALGGKFIATIGITSSELKSYSTNASFYITVNNFPTMKLAFCEMGIALLLNFSKCQAIPKPVILKAQKP